MTECVKQGHKPGEWKSENGVFVKRCERCNLIVVTG